MKTKTRPGAVAVGIGSLDWVDLWVAGEIESCRQSSGCDSKACEEV